MPHLYLFAALDTLDLRTLSRHVPHDDVTLSTDRTRALVSGPSGPVAASALPGRLAGQVTCLTRSEAALEWLGVDLG